MTHFVFDKFNLIYLYFDNKNLKLDMSQEKVDKFKEINKILSLDNKYSL